MELFERTVTSQTLFKGKVVTLQVDEVELPDGSLAKREVVRHSGGVTILPLAEDGTVTLVRQFRYALGQELLELPAGKLEPGEDHREAAERELGEETGLTAREITYLGHLVATPGYCDEKLHMYLARGLEQGEQHLDQGEFLNVVKLPFDRLLEQVMEGDIVDAKTAAAVMKTKILLEL